MVTGAVQAGPAGESKAKYSWITIAWGGAAIVAGIFLLARPGPTAVFLVRVMAIFCLVGGTVDVIGGLVRRGEPRSPWRTVGGVVIVVAALVVLVNPIFGAALV